MRELKIHACEDAHISVPMAELKDICMYEPSYTSAHTQTHLSIIDLGNGCLNLHLNTYLLNITELKNNMYASCTYSSRPKTELENICDKPVHICLSMKTRNTTELQYVYMCDVRVHPCIYSYLC